MKILSNNLLPVMHINTYFPISLGKKLPPANLIAAGSVKNTSKFREVFVQGGVAGIFDTFGTVVTHSRYLSVCYTHDSDRNGNL